MPISDDVISFIANVVGVLIGAFLGYLLGLRQQRILDNERDEKTRKDLITALKDELTYLVTEVTKKPTLSSELFGSLNFDVVFLDLPTFTSIVNSGQLLLLNLDIVRGLRDLNTQVHEHNFAQGVFVGIAGSRTLSESDSAQLNAALQSPDTETRSRVGQLAKVVIGKRQSIALKAQELIQKLSAAS